MSELSFEQKFYNELAKATVERENKEFELVRPYCEDIFKQIVELYKSPETTSRKLKRGIIVNVVNKNLVKHLWIKDLHKIHNDIMKDKEYMPYFLPTIFVDNEKMASDISVYLHHYYGLDAEYCIGSSEFYYCNPFANNITYIMDKYYNSDDKYKHDVIKSILSDDYMIDSSYWDNYLAKSENGPTRVFYIKFEKLNNFVERTDYYKENSPKYHYNRMISECK